MLTIKNVNYKISNDFCLNAINLEIDKGLYHLLGPNGSGKTSLLNLITGLCDADSGQIYIGNTEVNTINLPLQSNIRAYLTQKQNISFALTVTDMLSISLDMPEKDFYDVILKHDVLKGLDLTLLLHRTLSSLSGGENQRAHIARVLLQSDVELFPLRQVLILDEPFTGLDAVRKIWLNEYLQKLSKQLTIILCHHELNMALKTRDHGIIMHKGKIHLLVNNCSKLKKQTINAVFDLPESVLMETNGYISQIIGI